MNAESPRGDGEAAFWESRWSTGETPWDHGEPAPPLVEYVEAHGAPSGEVLVPGCGNGRDAAYLASLGARVLGMDLAPTAVLRAREESAHPNARYQQGNFLAPPAFLQKRFDWIVEHTCLCAMPPRDWPAYAASVRYALKRGGHYLAVFFRNPDVEEGPPHGISAEAIEALFGKGFQLLHARVPGRAYATRTGREEIRCYRYLG